MAKWFSLFAFLIAGAAAYFVFATQPLVEKLQSEGAKHFKSWEATTGVLKTTKEELAKTKAELAKEQADHTATKATLATTEENLKTAKAELVTAQTNLAAKTKELEDIEAQIKELVPGGDLKQVGALKVAIDGLKADKIRLDGEVTEAKKKIGELDAIVASLTDQNKTLTDETGKQKKVIKKYVDHVMEKNIRGRVLAVNSGWGFVVTSLGDKQGAAANKTLIVSRGGQAIGKLKISNIEANQSIADILPGTFVGNTYVQPGDDVIYTGDEKVKVEDAPAAPGAVGAPELPRR